MAHERAEQRAYISAVFRNTAAYLIGVIACGAVSDGIVGDILYHSARFFAAVRKYSSDVCDAYCFGRRRTAFGKKGVNAPAYG